MTRSRYRILNEQSPHFMTATVNIVLDSWRFLQRETDFTWQNESVEEVFAMAKKHAEQIVD